MNICQIYNLYFLRMLRIWDLLIFFFASFLLTDLLLLFVSLLFLFGDEKLDYLIFVN